MATPLEPELAERLADIPEGHWHKGDIVLRLTCSVDNPDECEWSWARSAALSHYEMVGLIARFNAAAISGQLSDLG